MVNGFINTLVAFLMGGATLSFSFTATDASGNVHLDTEGTAITLGENYRVETDEVVVSSDGTVKGIYQKRSDEMVIMPVTDGGDIMDNPFSLLKNAEKYYSVTAWKGDEKLTRQASGTLPDKVELRTKGGETYIIRINGIRKNDSADKTLFTLNPGDYPTAVVTDLR